MDMRDAFFDELYNLMKEDSQIILVVADHGAFGINKIKSDFPNQYINVGIAEQNLISVAAGLALSGKIVYVYAINSFLTTRCLDQINIDIASMKLHVNLIGVGAGLTYSTDGPTHHGISDVSVMSAIPNIWIYNCSDEITTKTFADIGYQHCVPKYIRIEKGELPQLHEKISTDGLSEVKAGNNVTIVSSGRMVHSALKAATTFNDLEVGVIDVYKLKPFPTTAFVDKVRSAQSIVVYEDNVNYGGLADRVCSALIQEKVYKPVSRWNLGDSFCYNYSTDRDKLESEFIKERFM